MERTNAHIFNGLQSEDPSAKPLQAHYHFSLRLAASSFESSLCSPSLSGAKGRHFIDLSLNFVSLDAAAPKSEHRPSSQQDDKRQYLSQRLEGYIRLPPQN